MSRHAARARSATGSRIVFPPSDSRAGVLLWIALALLVATRALAALAPSMALWGWNVPRFLAPAWAWAPWALAALALAPPLARPLAGGFEAAGRAIARRPGIVGALAALGAGALVLAFPDRIHFVGDSMLRLGALARGENPTQLSPQAFPLDVLVHYAAPFELVRSGRASPQSIVLAIGAAGAALLALASVGFARALEASPAGRVAAAAVTLFGGYVCLYTGESKAFAEMVALVVGFAAFALGAMRPSASPWALLGAGACVAVGVLFHRFALGLLPAWALMWILHVRVSGASGVRPSASFARRTLILLAVMAPVAVLAAMAPRIADTVVRYDLATNFANAEARDGGGVLVAALEPARLLDVLNLVLFLAPLAIAALFVTPGRTSRASNEEPGSAAAVRRRQGGIALAIALPFAAVFLLARPPQGLIRDWDSFATAAAALAVLAAWGIARAIDRSGRAWLAVPVVVVAAAWSVQWLAHHADETRSLARLEALMLEPPPRPLVDRARTWDVIGWRHFGAQRYDQAVRAFEQATAAAPSPRNLTHWGMAEVMTGDHARALELYTMAAERDTTFLLAWLGVGVAAINVGDLDTAERAARHLVRIAPEHERTQAIVQYLRSRGR